MNLLSFFYINLNIPYPDILTASFGARFLAWPGFSPSLVIWASACLQVINKKQKNEGMPGLVTILGHHFITLSVTNHNKRKYDHWKMHLFRCCSRLCWSLLCIWGQHGFWQTCQVLEAWSCKVSSCLFLDPTSICWVFSREIFRKLFSWLNSCAVLNEVVKKSA